jgi:enoyl-CoA hydratase
MSDSFETVLVEKVDSVTTITLNRPERLNAVNPTMRAELMRALDEIAQDESCSVVKLRGAGRAFCSGGDVKNAGRIGSGTELHKGDTAYDWQRGQANHQLLWKIWELPQPVVAQVHGYALGWGSLIVTVCDFVIVADDLRIGNAGTVMGAGMIGPKYVWAVGLRRAKWLDLLPAWRLTGKEAVEWGWANVSVPESELEAETDALIKELSTLTRTHLMFRKASLNQMWDQMGFRSTLSAAQSFDPLAHFSAAGREIENNIGDNGYVATTAKTNAAYLERHGR